MVTHIETRNNVVITHTSTAVAQVLQHGADRTQHTAFAYIATLSGIYGDSTARLRMYFNINQALLLILRTALPYSPE